MTSPIHVNLDHALRVVGKLQEYSVAAPTSSARAVTVMEHAAGSVGQFWPEGGKQLSEGLQQARQHLTQLQPIDDSIRQLSAQRRLTGDAIRTTTRQLTSAHQDARTHYDRLGRTRDLQQRLLARGGDAATAERLGRGGQGPTVAEATERATTLVNRHATRLAAANEDIRFAVQHLHDELRPAAGTTMAEVRDALDERRVARAGRDAGLARGSGAVDRVADVLNRSTTMNPSARPELVNAVVYRILSEDLNTALVAPGGIDVGAMMRSINWAERSLTAETGRGIQPLRGATRQLQRSRGAAQQAARELASVREAVANGPDIERELQRRLAALDQQLGSSRADLAAASNPMRVRSAREQVEMLEQERRAVAAELQEATSGRTDMALTLENAEAAARQARSAVQQHATQFQKLLAGLTSSVDQALADPGTAHNVGSSFRTFADELGISFADDAVTRTRWDTTAGEYVRRSDAGEAFDTIRMHAGNDRAGVTIIDNPAMKEAWDKLLASLDEDVFDTLRRIDERIDDPVMYITAVEHTLRSADRNVRIAWERAQLAITQLQLGPGGAERARGELVDHLMQALRPA